MSHAQYSYLLASSPEQWECAVFALGFIAA
jgi:hypothetical protein